MEKKLGLKSKNMDGYAPSDLIFEEDVDEEDQEIMDYVNIMVDDVPK